MKMSVKDYPELLKTWDFRKNEIDPNKVPHWSKEKFWWRCPEGKDHEWCTPPAFRLNQLNCDALKISNYVSECPFCCNKKVSITNSLATKFPEIAKEWHPTKNKELTPNKVVYGHSGIVWWQCLRNNHEFKCRVIDRTSKNRKCIRCIPVGGSLEETHPIISKEWDYSKNILKPNEIATFSNKKCWWLCNICGNSWRVQVQNRTNRGDGCPNCKSNHHSKPERYIRFELNQFLTLAPEGTKIKIENKNYDVDILIPDLNLIVEYDGNYFHKNRIEIDKNKTLILTNNGWDVIRIRESSKQIVLCRITDDDIIMSAGISLKTIINELLLKIKMTYNVNYDIENYLKQINLQNKKLADAYILEQMLKEREILSLTKDSNKESRASEIKNKIIYLAIEVSMLIKDIIIQIKEDYDIDLNREIIRDILKQSGKKRKGIRWLERELRTKLENRALDLLNNHYNVKVVVSRIKEEFNITISASTLNLLKRSTAIVEEL